MAWPTGVITAFFLLESEYLSESLPVTKTVMPAAKVLASVVATYVIAGHSKTDSSMYTDIFVPNELNACPLNGQHKICELLHKHRLTAAVPQAIRAPKSRHSRIFRK
ncbi:hypothetical protein BaRGS_00033222 [Batillaria attramentaria]|uniref:Uncharacterized protein n=1 Tax=Batillaria attramentaria TaxID=370345 RepID=A0ABD0JL69_9CAEN